MGVRGHEKVPGSGHEKVPAGGQVKVPASSICHVESELQYRNGDGDGVEASPSPPREFH